MSVNNHGDTLENLIIPNSFLTPRKTAERVITLLKENSELTAHYNNAKNIVRAFRKPAFYEIETRCNLKCEGCYYFEGGETQTTKQVTREEDWKDFFKQESARGVSMAYFVGAEPALAQHRLLAAAEQFPWGNIGTNGTIKIDRDIPYRIGVSVWASNDADDIKLRGASVFRKALNNYKGDPRAIMLFTVSKWNISSILEVAKMCADHGVELTYNIYSPTKTFLEKIDNHESNDKYFFRQSNTDHSPILSNDDLSRARDLMNDTIELFPGTVIYSKAYNDFMCTPGSRYDLDENGIATNCHSRIVDPMRYYTTDLQSIPSKCCTPDVDCSSCRMYSGGWSSKFVPSVNDLKDRNSFISWLNIIDTLGKIFLYKNALR
ncbi:hypothetical protein C4K68_28055 [Pokkaliibacter plantistimulans]|uniref:Radical SAM protein n=1 Tax=Proteobacteria bacterium 228 TaxID=2083153 RepID=A0A2S5KHX2_9PROT|nr:radical SAM protein [Pokkaliibacter plantistimulans]PPC73976.1 hypothetical protein C4K68_28055 [Pokkaliibacter plantistimulans]